MVWSRSVGKTTRPRKQQSLKPDTPFGFFKKEENSKVTMTVHLKSPRGILGRSEVQKGSKSFDEGRELVQSPKRIQTFRDKPRPQTPLRNSMLTGEEISRIQGVIAEQRLGTDPGQLKIQRKEVGFHLPKRKNVDFELIISETIKQKVLNQKLFNRGLLKRETITTPSYKPMSILKRKAETLTTKSHAASVLRSFPSPNHGKKKKAEQHVKTTASEVSDIRSPISSRPFTGLRVVTSAF